MKKNILISIVLLLFACSSTFERQILASKSKPNDGTSGSGDSGTTSDDGGDTGTTTGGTTTGDTGTTSGTTGDTGTTGADTGCMLDNDEVCGGDTGTTTGGTTAGDTGTTSGTTGDTGTTGGDTGGTTGGNPGGIIGGHFDLDTSHLVYPLSHGTTDKHIHEYDDKYSVDGADFFHMFDQGLGEINEIISNPSKRFFLITANSNLSTGGKLFLNGTVQNVLSFQNQQNQILSQSGTPQVYTLGAPQVAGDQQLTDLKIFFDLDVLQNGGLIPTATGCVRKNNPGALGEYRNGALIIQAIDADVHVIDPVTGVAANVTGNGLLWEATIFWHRDGTCYGSANYVR